MLSQPFTVFAPHTPNVLQGRSVGFPKATCPQACSMAASDFHEGTAGTPTCLTQTEQALAVSQGEAMVTMLGSAFQKAWRAVME